MLWLDGRGPGGDGLGPGGGGPEATALARRRRRLPHCDGILQLTADHLHVSMPPVVVPRSGDLVFASDGCCSDVGTEQPSPPTEKLRVRSRAPMLLVIVGAAVLCVCGAAALQLPHAQLFSGVARRRRDSHVCRVSPLCASSARGSDSVASASSGATKEQRYLCILHAAPCLQRARTEPQAAAQAPRVLVVCGDGIALCAIAAWTLDGVAYSFAVRRFDAY